jgi:hypothetical protein
LTNWQIDPGSSLTGESFRIRSGSLRLPHRFSYVLVIGVLRNARFGFTTPSGSRSFISFTTFSCARYPLDSIALGSKRLLPSPRPRLSRGKGRSLFGSLSHLSNQKADVNYSKSIPLFEGQSSLVKSFATGERISERQRGRDGDRGARGNREAGEDQIQKDARGKAGKCRRELK